MKIPYKFLSAVSHISVVTWVFAVGSAWIRLGLWGKTIRSYGSKKTDMSYMVENTQLVSIQCSITSTINKRMSDDDNGTYSVPL